MAQNAAYAPLFRFRILTLLPAETRDADIHCTTAVHSFEDIPKYPYRALSYTWGKEEDGDPQVRLNNILVTVTRNLELALRYLRPKSQETTWWIDQLCINQEDKDEKSTQVSRMKDIFSSAEEVISWVGESNSDFRELERFVKEHQSIFQKTKPSTRRHIQHNEIYEKDVVKRLPSKVVMPVIDSFFDRHYWSRLWVIEEVVLAQKRRIRCGDEHMDISELRQLLKAQKRFWHLNQLPLKWLSAFGMKAHSDMYLHDVLIVASDASTKKAVDRIYGVLGMVTCGKGREIRPDYSLTACSVYCKAIDAIVEDLTSETKSRYIQEKFKERIREKCEHNPFAPDSTLASDPCPEAENHFGDLFHRYDGMIGLRRLWIKVLNSD